MSNASKTDSLFLLSERFFKPGVITNFYPDRERVGKELDSGTLEVKEFDGGFCVLRKREGYYLMNFSSFDSAVFPDIPVHTVTEIPLRAKSGVEARVLGLLASAGFSLLFRRVRLTRAAAETHPVSDPDIRLATDEDIPDICRLMDSSFDRRTGCLPDPQELNGARVWIYEKDGTVAGCLHEKDERAVSELRHLCTDRALRGTGIASRLTDVYLSSISKKSRVWVREDYSEARHIYETRGYEPDGMISLVMAKD